MLLDKGKGEGDMREEGQVELNREKRLVGKPTYTRE
jgi:hypothetical protein